MLVYVVLSIGICDTLAVTSSVMFCNYIYAVCPKLKVRWSE